MFCLPDIHSRKKILGGPLSHREYNNNLFLKLADKLPKNNQSTLTTFKHTKRIEYRGRRSSLAEPLAPSPIVKQPPAPKSPKCLPYVTVFLIDSIYSYQQIRQKIVVLDLEKYFEAYFKKVLKGDFSTEFYSKIEPYIQIIAESSSKEPARSLPIEYLQLEGKQALMQAIDQIEKKGDHKLAVDVVKYFCIPSEEYREEVIKDIKLILKQQLRETFDYLESQLQGEFVLIDMKKQPITDLLRIRFNTVSMMFASSTSCDKSYQRFFTLNREQATGKKKSDFIDTIRLNFRISNPKLEVEQPPLSTARTTTTQGKPKPKQQRSIQQIRRLRNNSPSPRITTKDAQKQKLLSEFNVPSDILQHFYQQFRDLRLNNDLYRKGFNILNQHEHILLMETLCKHSPFLRGKSKQALNRIFTCLSINPNQQYISPKQYIQFRLIVNCAVKEQQLLSFLSKYLGLNVGPLTKSQLSAILMLTLGEPQTGPNATRVIVDIMWVWLKRNHFIQLFEDTELLRLRQFLEKFGKNELIYYFIVSIIFGTSEVSPVDLAYSIVL